MLINNYCNKIMLIINEIYITSMRVLILVIAAILIINTVHALEFQEPTPTQGEDLHEWWAEIVEICTGDYQLDPYLMAAVVKKESWFDENAENIDEKEAYLSDQDVWYENYWGKGLMQMTGPWTAGVPRPRQEEWEYNMPREAVWEEAPIMNDPFNGEENLGRGCWYFSALMGHYSNDEYSATTAYNKGWQGTDAGQFNVRDNDYVNDVMRYRTEYISIVNSTQAEGNITNNETVLDPAEDNDNETVDFDVDPDSFTGGDVITFVPINDSSSIRSQDDKKIEGHKTRRDEEKIVKKIINGLSLKNNIEENKDMSTIQKDKDIVGIARNIQSSNEENSGDSIGSLFFIIFIVGVPFIILAFFISTWK